MDCWICGDKAETREHRVKASDLRKRFGHVNQNSPIYLHSNAERNVNVPGIKSDKLTYTALLCARCNNELTQAHDRAWSVMSDYLDAHPPQVGSVIDLEQVFPGRVGPSMLAVHLYFAKAFGCMIAQGRVPIDLRPFAHAIRGEQPHDRLFLALWANPTNDVGQSDLEAAHDKLFGRVAFATWFHFTGSAAINVMYAEPGECREGLLHAWHPRSGETHLVVANAA